MRSPSSASLPLLLLLFLSTSWTNGLAPPSFHFTHMEVNSQLWRCTTSSDSAESESLHVLVDPLAGTLDFGLPDGIYAGKGAVLTDSADTLERITRHQPKLILITQSWDDHLHPATLRLLAGALPKGSYRVIAPPSGERKLLTIFDREAITVLRPGDVYNFTEGSSLRGSITCTEGSLVGPPWSTREAGYICRWGSSSSGRGMSVYYEPHSDVDVAKLTTGRSKWLPSWLPGVRASQTEPLRVDVVIAPVVRQAMHLCPLPASSEPSSQSSSESSPGLPHGPSALPSFTLVHGGARALEIAQAFSATTLIPLLNGDIKAEGVLAPFVVSTGSRDATAILAAEISPGIEVLDPTPGGALMVVAAAPL
mmetsp:Transcript_55439/g.111239  ORF Transcript_55439/g.111239 Transcript_55439/m.111239 type:complete len:366 (-) Transcript_55439:111-1208(-)